MRLCIGILIVLSLLQCGCYQMRYSKTPAPLLPSLKHRHYLKEDKFLIEYSTTFDLDRIGYMHYLLISPAEDRARFYYDDEGGAIDIPTRREYLRNKHIWLIPQERYSRDKSRIIALLPKGIPYYIVAVKTSDRGGVTKIFVRLFKDQYYRAEYIRSPQLF